MILYITRKYPPSIGGMQRFNNKLVTHLTEITPIKIIKWGGSQIVLPLFVIYAFFVSIFICLSHKINCIYVADGVLAPLGLVLKWLVRKPVVANIHGRDIAFDLKLYQFLIPRSLKHLDHIVCVSDALKNECIKRGIPNNILSTISNGINIEDFAKPGGYAEHVKTIEKRTGIALKDKKILLTVGRLVAKKGVLSFLKNTFESILKKHPDTVYLIVGDGPDENAIRAIIKEKGFNQNAFCLGALSMDSGLLPTIYRLADLFIMPNISVKDDMEGFGIVAIEAAASGLVVVASNVDGISQAVKDNENGMLIPASDYAQFSSIVCRLLEDAEGRAALAQKAKVYTQDNYTWDKIAQKYLTTFNQFSGK